jgi:hypothetical protein
VSQALIEDVDVVSDPFVCFGVPGAEVTLDLRVGHIRRFQVEYSGRRIEPLHSAPWVDDPAITEDKALPLTLRFLSGDFFCAPFGANDLELGPQHGASAGTQWRHLETMRFAGGVTARFLLEAPIMGASLLKEFTLRDGHPFLYERHVFLGGNGAIPVANHAMTKFAAGGQLFFSPKAYGFTPRSAQEGDPTRERSRLARPVRFEDFTRVPLTGGGTTDITRYPIAERHEDFVVLVEKASNPLGWFAAVRPDEGDLFLSLKNPQDYPFTFLWFSNGGRDYLPWNGRHRGVLGIEEGRAYADFGHRASIAPNELSDAGIATALTLRPETSAEVRNIIGGLPLDNAWSGVTSVSAEPGRILITDSAGSVLSVPFDQMFFELAK